MSWFRIGVGLSCGLMFVLACEVEQRDRPPARTDVGGRLTAAVGQGAATVGSGGAGGSTGTLGGGGGGVGGFDAVAELAPFCGCVAEFNTLPCSDCKATADLGGCQAVSDACSLDQECSNIQNSLDACPGGVVDTTCLSTAVQFATPGGVALAKAYFECICSTSCTADCSQAACQ